MHRIFDFQHEDVGDIANRIAMTVHKAVDRHFPEIANTSKRFNKTVFSSEDTLIQNNAAATASAAESRASRPPTVATPEARRPEEQRVSNAAPNSDLGTIAPSTGYAPLEYSRAEPTQILSPRSGKLKKMLFIILLVTAMSLLAAYWVHTVLIGNGL